MAYGRDKLEIFDNNAGTGLRITNYDKGYESVSYKRVYNRVPEGFKKMPDKRAPKGYTWYRNDKPLTSVSYEEIIVSDRSTGHLKDF